jgi:uncharacterized protein (DUF488 family)
MTATAFDEDNAVLGPPEGMTEDDVFSLSVYQGVNDVGEPVVVSCWKPTKEELAEINRTGRVWLMVMGKTMPPVCLEGISPFKRLEPPAEGQPAQN